MNIYQKTMKLIEKGWCQNEIAMDKDRNPISCMNPKVAYYSLVGALMKVSRPDKLWYLQCRSLFKILPTNIHGRLSDWNDAPKRTQKEVLIALRDASNLYEDVDKYTPANRPKKGTKRGRKKAEKLP